MLLLFAVLAAAAIEAEQFLVGRFVAERGLLDADADLFQTFGEIVSGRLPAVEPHAGERVLRFAFPARLVVQDGAVELHQRLGEVLADPVQLAVCFVQAFRETRI